VPVVYPNPVIANLPVYVHLPLQGLSEVKVELFTLAFRKVLSLPTVRLNPGQDLSLPLQDSWGANLADGIYYVAVTVNGKRMIAKLLILK
jgi:hypothetical protein